MGSLGLIGIARWPRFVSLPIHHLMVGALGITLVLGMALQVVPARRFHLAASLAGAGDTAAIARSLATEISPAGVVWTFEGDGTATQFAYARVPVNTHLASEDVRGSGGQGGDAPDINLMQLADPVVASTLKRLGVEYFAIGTTSRYWDTSEAYSWRLLLEQPQLSLAHQGTDMVVLRYRAGTDD